jgi:NADH-quinone oxidoreductase subunit N
VLSDANTIVSLLPEIVLVLCATGILVAGTFYNAARLWPWLAVGAYVLAAGTLCWLEAGRWTASESAQFFGPLVSDPLAFLWRHLSLIVGILFSLHAASRRDLRLQSEIQGLLMLLVAGMLIACRANELALAFLSLELVSIPTYVLLYLGRKDQANAEATTKYFYLSIFSSAVFVYGLTFLYGVAGTTWITSAQGPSLQAALSEAGQLSTVGLILALVGLGFKIAAVPFHFYAPDVYQGTTYTNAAVLSVAPKIAGMVVMTRLLVVGFSAHPELMWQLTCTLALLTMTLGNVCALWQKNLRRLMAYSSIAHGGYLLIGITVASAAIAERLPFGGIAAVSFYMFAYSVATIGVFTSLACYQSAEDSEVYSVEQLSGFSRRHPWHAAALAVFLLSLTGIPPLVGFWGKLALLLSALARGMTPASGAYAFWFVLLAVAGAINAAVAAAYYLRVIAVMYFGTDDARRTTQVRAAPSMPLQIAALLCVTLVVGLGVEQRPLSDWAQRAEQGIATTLKVARTESTKQKSGWHAVDRYAEPAWANRISAVLQSTFHQ